MMEKRGPTRRAVLAGAAASALPLPCFAQGATARPAFMAAHAEFMAAMAACRQARKAAAMAHPRLLAMAGQTNATAYIMAGEIRERGRTLFAARVAAGRVYMPEAANDTEAAMQEEALAICENELGADDGQRTCYPPHRRLMTV